jgi:hypothetical protein
MAFIGDPDIYIGGDWFSGGWYDPAGSTASDYLGQRTQDLWIYYTEDDAGVESVITTLDFQELATPTNTIGQIVKARYRGFRPIDVSGFYLTEVPREFYDGNRTNLYDKEELIRWADQYAGNAGIEVEYTDADGVTLVTTRFSTGFGDTPATFIPYTGHEDGIVHRDDTIDLVLRITMPSAATHEVVEAAKFHFGFEIAFIEVPDNLAPAIPSEVC